VVVAWVVDVAGLVVVVPRLRVVLVVGFFLSSSPPHDAAISGNSARTTINRPYARGEIPRRTWRIRASLSPLPDAARMVGNTGNAV
jgi:hypothetical protein